MGRRKNNAPAAPSESGLPDAAAISPNAEVRAVVGPGDELPTPETPNFLVTSKDGKPITAGFLAKVLQTMPPHTEICLCIGPDYQEVPLTDAVLWRKKGGLYLVGDMPLDKDEDEPTEADWVEVPACESEVEEFDRNLADEA